MRRSPRWSPRFAAPLLCAIVGIAFLLAAGRGVAGRGSDLLYPNLKTLPPTDLEFAIKPIDDDGNSTTPYVDRHLLIFSNTIWNAGTGPLDLRGKFDGNGNPLGPIQRISRKNGDFLDRSLPDAAFIFHPIHDHWHFEKFAQYELFRDDRGELKQIKQTGRKTSFCLMDTRIEVDRPGVTPKDPVYDACGQEVQGVSVGWGDTYGSHLYDQWIVLGDSFLPDGKYVLRSIADPKNILGEGGRTQNSPRNNTARACFTVKDDQITSQRPC